MKKQDYIKLAFIIGGILILWFLYRRRMQMLAAQNADDNSTSQSVDPQTAVYAVDPSRFDPVSLGDLNINIANQGLGYLSNQYIPLFGFVGMAQGVAFQ